MSNELSFKERLLELEEWIPEIVDCIKKDLKNEHLKKDYQFSKKYFSGKNYNKLENDELIKGYLKALKEEEAGESLAEFIVHHWIFKNSELYHFFEDRLSKINSDFTQIKELTEEQGESIEQTAFQEFGAIKTYIFSCLNGVAFSKGQLKKMANAASQERLDAKERKTKEEKARSIEEMKSEHEREMVRLKDKYEKKLLGFQKKYTQDIGILKKQLGNLQRKLSGV